MISYLKVPKTTLPNFYEKAKFALTWRIAIMFSVVVLFLSIATFIVDDRFFEYYLAVLFVSVSSVVFMYIKRTYKFIAKILLSGATLVIIASVVSVPDAVHLIEALWMTVAILAAFFTLGNLWGMIFLCVNSGLYAFYFIFLFRDTAVLRVAKSQEHDLMMSIEFTFAMFLIGYIMYQFGMVNSYARTKSKNAFKELEKEKLIVERQNEEKTVLLQEIHHRVKNNLQVIISLLRIQSNELQSQETIDSFDEAISRILTMSLVHQKMYEKESLVDIDIQDYFQTLLEDLIYTNSTSEDISFQIQSSVKNVSVETIVPLGLIINELVSNSLKHAFEKNGKINIELYPVENNRIKLIYSDNGKWKETNRKNSFGLQLIDVFTEQLDGKYDRVSSEEGTTYEMEFDNVED